MIVTFSELRRIAELEYGDLVVDSQPLSEKLRLFLSDGSMVDIWLSRTLPDRFGLHWERRHLDNTFYRYDNFPNTAWRNVSTYPRHFHNGSQNDVEAAPFSADLLTGFRQFMDFVRTRFTLP
ncbi:toxin-antitoxin system TumE family protein [Candidatus Amarolinea aalborgensis]|jgi:hypothetical protein|uniref:toxin-antitoxin system TumE family protein n=1 Tax=Candidatus Amarolinea aalborgensis TaxID=2249329 RepID=UPI003BF9CB5E